MTAQNLTSEALIPVNWKPVPMGHVNGLLVGYSIKFQRIKTAEKAVFDSEEETLIVQPSELSAFLAVQTYSIYRIKVAAFTQKGMGPYSKYVYAGTFLMYVFNVLLCLGPITSLSGHKIKIKLDSTKFKFWQKSPQLKTKHF